MNSKSLCLALLLLLGDAVPASSREPDVLCFGRRPTITGTPKEDVIRGTPGNDVIRGGGGRDDIYGLGGDDVLCGAGRSDRLFGGRGDDTLSGGNNTDGVYGGAGDDYVAGGTSRDWLTGGPGDDRFRGGKGPDDVVSFFSALRSVRVELGSGTVAGEGDDLLVEVEVVYGSEYSDVLLGDEADNIFYAERGDDRVVGAGGSDRLDGGTGIDVIDAGHGRDLLDGGEHDDQGDADRLIAGPARDFVVADAGDDTYRGGRGQDRLSFGYAEAGVSVDLVAEVATGNGSDVLSGFEEVLGTDFDDVIKGDSRRNKLFGFGGEADHIFGRSGADLIRGEGRFFGGTGNDSLRLDHLSDNSVVGGPGFDIVDYSGWDADLYVNLATGRASHQCPVEATCPSEFLHPDELAGIEGARLGSGSDEIHGDRADNLLVGGGGEDQVYGNDGDDLIYGGANGHYGEPDRLVGGSGTDECHGAEVALQCE